tara:strand:- start:2125 stop:4488 length:2364 start_codon:yes stop_codon:yes gene_type:complete
MATTKTTEETFTGNGSTTTFPFTIEYETTKTNHLKVFLGDALQTETTHYSISGTNLIFVTAPINGKSITIRRDTDVDGMMATYSPGSSIRSLDLNNNHEQLLFHAQEIENRETNRFFTGTTPPTNPVAGAVWFEPVSGRSYVYYVDVDSGQWVESNPAFSVGDLSNVSLTGLTDTNIAGNANISQSKLNLAITNSEVAANAAIAQSKLATLSISNANIPSNAAIAQSKLATLSIGASELASNAVTNVKVASNAAIDAAKIEFQPPYPNSVARDLESKLANETFNVKDYGAKGDNSQDDKPAIQAAIDACGNNGGKVVFPPGFYRLDSTINITTTDHAIILEGLAGMTVNKDTFGVRLSRTDGASTSYIKCEHARSVQIKNIAFVGGTFNTINTGGAGVRPSDTTAAIHVDAEPGTQEYVFENLQFYGITQCIILDGLSSSIIRNCKFRNIPEGADGNAVIKLLGSNLTDRSDQIRILDCIIDGSPAAGITGFSTPEHWQASTNTYSVGNKVKNDKDRAYEVISLTNTEPNPNTTAASGGPTGTNNSIVDNKVTWKFLGNTINRTVRGILIDGDVNTIFIQNTSVIRCKDNYFFNSSWNGEFVYFQNAESERALVDGFSLNGTKGFIKIDNGFSSSCFDNGINLNQQLKTSVSMTNCNIRDNQNCGIRIDSNQSIANVSIINPIMGGNSKSGLNAFSGIFIEDNIDNVSIIGGRIGGGTTDLLGTSWQKYGIDVSGTNHEHIRILGVDVVGNSTAGIQWSTGGINAVAGSYNFIKYCPGYSDGQTQFP